MSEVVCCPLSSSDEGDSPKFYKSTKPIAKRGSTCNECGGKIVKGECYERVNAMWPWNEKPETYRTCALCLEIRTHFACGSWIFGQLWEDLENNFFPDMKAGGVCMEGLSPNAKAKIIEARMEWYFGQDEIDDSTWEGWKRPQP